jgi:putative salt-induced outer membrane protein YdiY
MRRVLMTAVVTAMLLAAGVASAATVWLAGGDRITGGIEQMDGNELTIETGWGGTLTIDRASIDRIESDEPFTVYFEDGTTRSLTTLDLAADDPPGVAGVEFDPDAPVIEAAANLGYAKAEGNTDTQSLHLDASFSMRDGDNRYRLRGAFDQARENGDLTEENWSTRAAYDRFLTDRLFITGHADYESDQFGDLVLRQKYGAGVGYVVWDDPRGHLEVQAGPAYVIENFDEADDDSYISGAWAVDATWWVWPDRVELFHMHDGTVSAEDISNVILTSSTGLRVPLWRYIFMTLQVDVDWRSEPPADSEAFDRRYLTTIGFSY